MFSQLCEVLRTALLILQATIAFALGTLDETFQKKRNAREGTAPRSYRRAFQDWGNISMSDKYYVFSLILGHFFGNLLGRPPMPINDRKVPFEKLMQFLADLPNDRVSNRIVAKTTSTYIKKFWDDIERPPTSYFGQNWRRGDGSFNSMIYPSMGKAGSAYAMTVQRSRISPELPSASKLFDRLMSRENLIGNKKFEPHPSGLNAFFFYLATLITHDLFHSDPRDPLRNLTTSYADLAPLYGASKEDQDKIRKHEDGLLLPDTWSDSFRLLFQPPGISALLIIFSRNHNRIAKMLKEINENGFLNNLTDIERDETLFQISRNVNCACYANLILNDYVRSILGLQPGQDPVLNPLMTPPRQDSKSGNAVSLEFNFVYRWHSAISEADAEWCDKLFNSSSAFHDYGNFKRKLQIGLGQMELARATNDPAAAAKREEIVGHIVHEIGKVFDFQISDEDRISGHPHVIGYHRNKDTGLFADKDIINMIKTAMRSRAGRLGANHVPASLKHVEIAGIEQARKAGVATLNEFREYFQLKKYEKFEEVNPNPQVARALSQLYRSVDDVELYPGLVIEQTKKSGVSLPYTISRAILADAVNLLRNDRFYTDELTRFKLTNAGFDLASGASGRYHTAFPNMLHDLFPGAFDQSDLENIFMMPDINDGTVE